MARPPVEALARRVTDLAGEEHRLYRATAAWQCHYCARPFPAGSCLVFEGAGAQAVPVCGECAGIADPALGGPPLADGVD